MVDHIETGADRPTRRSLLQGAGLLAGAAAVGGLITTSAFAAEDGAQVGPNGVGDGTAAAGDVGAQAVTAGLAYRTWGEHSFRANFSANGYSVSGDGCYCSTNSGYVVAGLDLPAGAVIREVTFGVYATTAVSYIALSRWPITNAAADETIATVTPDTSGAQTLTQSGLSHAIDPDYVYQAGVFTLSSGNVRARSLRVGFTGGYGFAPVSPQVRKLDTRNPGPLAGAIVGGQTKTLTLAPSMPATAASALLNLTVTDTTGAGYLSLFPAGTSWPGTSSINWSGSGQTLATSVTVAVSSAGAINILGGGGGSAEVIVDLLGYYI